MRLSTFDDWSRGHHGILTFKASGLSRSAWYRAIDAGSLAQIHPMVARMPGAATTPEQGIAAAVAAVSGDALASHRSAIRLWGLPRPDDDPVDVLTTSLDRGVELDGAILHRTRDRDDLVRLRRYSIPCTNILRTLVDLGAVDAPAVSDSLGHAIATRLADLRAIELTLTTHSRPERDGVTALRAAIDRWIDVPAPDAA